MISRRGLLTLGAVALFSLGLTASPADAGTSSQEPLAIVVAKNSAVHEMSLYQLKRLYLGDSMNTPDGKKLLPLNRGTNTHERVGFDKTVLNMTPEEAARYWIDRRIRGLSGAPKSVDPANVLQKVVARLPGSVSYVRQSEVTDTVKVIKVEGKLPGDAGYPVSAVGRSNARTSSPSFFDF
ncbi:MAG TPA: hypothetical protein VI197_30295 [Polyangiaceae bacterium]